MKTSQEIYVCGNPMFRLCMKLKVLKAGLKELNDSEFGVISKRVKEARTSLDQCQCLVNQNPNDLDL